jgi:uncharacterized damage-inducible protein DinB
VDLQDLRTLLDYHYWARDRVLDAAERLTPGQYGQDLGSSFRSVRDTLAHVYSAEWVWYSRWQGASPARPLLADELQDVAALRAAWRAHEQKMRAFVDGLGEQGVSSVCHYTTFAGQAGSSAFQEMLQHVVNHASYHRGQVTTMLRQLGAEPPRSMDLITFYREGGGRSR